MALHVPNCTQRATPGLYFLLLPPGSTTCFAHCALRSKLHYHLPRLAAAWGSGITGSGLSSPFPLLRSTQSRSDRAENFEANTHPYRIPTLLPYTSTQPLIQLTPVSIDTTIRLWFVCADRPMRGRLGGALALPPSLIMITVL